MKDKITDFLNTLEPLLPKEDNEQRADAAKIREIGDTLEREAERIIEHEELNDVGKARRRAELARKTAAIVNAWHEGRSAEIKKHRARSRREVDAAINPVPTE